MTHVATTPHPVVPGMERNNYVCYACNETRTYMLPAAAEPAAEETPAQSGAAIIQK
jgi:hypothetical protein